jgi:putative restriction endonuclease
VIYHYPKTARPPGRDQNEIDATKAARRLGLPVFVITYPSEHADTRNVHLGWVEDWDDQARVFLIAFGEEPPSVGVAPPMTGDAPFRLVSGRRGKKREVEVREGQPRFKFQVLKRYGPRCAVCDLDLPVLLDAAHLCPKNEGGTDDPRNGLVFCAVHHRALDAGLFAIDPATGSIQFRDTGPTAQALRITRETLAHLPGQPHREALEWCWRRWTKGSTTG